MSRAFVLVLLGLGACSSLSSRSAFDSTALPPLNVTVTTDPPAAADGVYRDAVVRVTFDDYPDPDTVAFGPLTLRSGTGAFDAVVKVDLFNRAVTVQPRTLLDPGITYELVVGPTVAALSGRRVGTQVSASITVGASINPSPAPAPVKVTWNAHSCDPNDADYDVNNAMCVVNTCAPYCHSKVGQSGKARNPTRSLDLTGDPRDAVLGLVNVPSVGLRDTRWQLARVAPGDSARSVLLRKLIGGDAHLVSTDPTYPEMKVDGRRMPLDTDETKPIPAPLSDDQIRRIQAWIDQGAVIQN